MSDQKRLPLSGDKKIRFGGRYFMDWIVLKKCVRIVFAT